MRRVMCVYLPGLPLQRLGRLEPELRSKAVVLTDPTASRGPKVVLASRRATRAGVHPGLPLAEALAIEPRLVVLEQDLAADRRALLDLAKAADRYSPIVALEEGEQPQCLLLDVAGSASCFGGETALVERAEQDFRAEGWTVRLAITDTVGAAWGITHYGSCPCVVPAGKTEAALRPLPVAALRLPVETLALLGQLGLDRVRDLLRLPRRDLAERFGSLLLERLDQALGRAAEVVVPPLPEPDLQAGVELDFPVERFDAVLEVVGHLTAELGQVLGRRNLGARQLVCRLDHEIAAATTVELGLYRPSAAPGYLQGLLRTRFEQVELPAPVCAVRLTVLLAERLPEVQRAFFDLEEDEAGLGELIDRLSSLLGRQAVTRPRCLPEAQPEYAFCVEPVLTERRVAEVRPHARRGKEEREPAPPLLPRPLTLWPEPVRLEMVAAYPDGPPQWFRWEGMECRVVRCWGPERIETGWWRGVDVQRDYYVVTTQTGSRFWMFREREGGRWFVQGRFE